MDYDPTSNPRSLVSVPSPEDVETAEYKLAVAEQELQAIGRQISMFESSGWTDIDQQLVAELNRAYLVLGDPKTCPTPTTLAFVQGQIQGINVVRQMRDRIELRRKVLRQEVQSLRNQLNARAEV